MEAIVGMRQTPMYDWLFKHGSEYGWYPWHHEPWHWEYNPPGFKNTFYSDYEEFIKNCVGCKKQ
jgi:hypothetical protein